MSATREYLKKIQMPFILKMKFVLITLAITLACCIPAVYFSWQLYNEELTKSRIHWDHVFVPFSLPGIVLLIWACIAAYTTADFAAVARGTQPSTVRPLVLTMKYV